MDLPPLLWFFLALEEHKSLGVGRGFWFFSSLGPTGVHVLYTPFPACLLFHQCHSPLRHLEISGEGKGKVQAQPML